MSDKDKLIELLESWKVDYEIEDNVLIIKVPYLEKRPNTIVGYTGFFTEYHFDTQGTFKHVGIWE